MPGPGRRFPRAGDEIGLCSGCLCVYDATYLELALRERLPLATKDAALRTAAAKAGAKLLL